MWEKLNDKVFCRLTDFEKSYQHFHWSNYMCTDGELNWIGYVGIPICIVACVSVLIWKNVSRLVIGLGLPDTASPVRKRICRPCCDRVVTPGHPFGPSFRALVSS